MKPLNELEKKYYELLSGMKYESACKLYKEENVLNSVIGQNARDSAQVAIDLARRAANHSIDTVTMGNTSESDKDLIIKDFLTSEGIDPEENGQNVRK